MEAFLIQVADGKIGLGIHDDAVLVDLLNLVEVDDIGAMDAHERVGEPFFHLLHRQQGDDGLLLSFEPHLQVFAHGLDIADVGDADLDDAVVGLEE